MSTSTATPPRGWASRVAAIDNALYDAFGQRQIGLTYGAANQYRVVMEVTRAYLENADALKHLYVRSQRRRAGPAVGARHRRPAATCPPSINHQGQFPSVTLSFNLAPGKSLSDAVQAVQQAEARDPAPGQRAGRRSPGPRRPSSSHCPASRC